MKKIFAFLLFLNVCFGLEAKDINLDSLEQKLTTVSDSEKVTVLFEISKAYAYSDLEKYIALSQEALSLSEKIKDTLKIAKSHLQIGHYYLDKGDYKNSLAHFLQSLSLNEKINYKKGIANALFSLGNVYYYRDDLNTSIEYYNKCLPIYSGLKDTSGIALASNTLGIIYMSSAMFNEALTHFNNALKNYEQINDLLSQGQVLTNVSYVYTETKKYDLALNAANKGLNIARELKDPLGEAKALVSIAGIYSYQEKWNEALSYYNQGLEIANAEKDKNLIRTIYTELYSMYKRKGDFKQSLHYFEKGSKYKDSLFTLEANNQMAEMLTKYDTEKKENEIVLLTKDKDRQTIIRNSIIGGLILLIVLSFFILRSNRIKQKANRILKAQNIIIREKNKSISDSINYAQRIQQAILPEKEEIHGVLKDCFILFKPKDVVSGDFYAFEQKNEKVIIAAVDCTGHGVPGAFMSMIGHDQLSQIIKEKNIVKPSEILINLNKGIKSSLKQRDSGSETRDGMDLALCTIDLKNNKLEYSGAQRPLYHVNGQLTEIKANKMAIGGTTEEDYNYTNHEISFVNGDCFYIFSDGYADQFGGKNGKKFSTKQFKELLTDIHEKSMEEQLVILDNKFNSWKGELEQVDDILVIGFKV